MTRPIALLPALLPAAAWAQDAAPPMPANMTPAAEISFAIAAVAMVLMLAAAGWLVARR